MSQAADVMHGARRMPRRLALVGLLVLCACGEAGISTDAGSDLSVTICQPELPTCTDARCGAPCDPNRDAWCTDHGCFEPYVCECVVDHWICQLAGRGCDMSTAPPLDLAPSD